MSPSLNSKYHQIASHNILSNMYNHFAATNEVQLRHFYAANLLQPNLPQAASLDACHQRKKTAIYVCEGQICNCSKAHYLIGSFFSANYPRDVLGTDLQIFLNKHILRFSYNFKDVSQPLYCAGTSCAGAMLATIAAYAASESAST